MRIYAILAVSLLAVTSCDKKSGDRQTSAPAKAVEPVAAVATRPATPAPPAVPTPRFSGDVTSFVNGAIIGYDAPNRAIALFGREVHSEEFVAIYRYSVDKAGSPTASVTEIAQQSAATDEVVKNHGAVIAKWLAAYAPLTGKAFASDAKSFTQNFANGATATFVRKSGELTVKNGTKSTSVKFDGGGVTGVERIIGFEIPNTTLVAVWLDVRGDVVETHELHVVDIAP